ncbi:BatD family protein [Candidatus Gracilibacteria bacterium]|nr:BatD family protein [Candidatus Gracilibacteria bacterium]
MKIIIFFFLLILSFTQLYADIYSELSISHTQITLGESIILELTLSSEDIYGNIDYSIEGIDNFGIFSRGQKFQFQNINGEMQGSITYRLQLEANEVGSFKVGPSRFKIEDTTYINETIHTVEVISKDPQITLQNLEEGSIEEEIFPREQELYGLITDKKTIFSLKYTSYIIFLIILSTILGYILKVFQRSQKEKISSLPEVYISYYDMYFSGLSEADSSNIFYKKYITGVEHFLTKQDKNKKEYNPLTLTEMLNHKSFQNYGLKSDFIILYQSYYQKKELTNEEKKGYIYALKRYFT